MNHEHRPLRRTLVYALATLAAGMIAGAVIMWLLFAAQIS